MMLPLARLARLALSCVAVMLAASSSAQQPERAPIEALTRDGEKVLLHPNGRWQYVDGKKAAEAKKVAEQFPENRLRPEGAQGGLFGIGRTVLPGDPEYNRGSLNPKLK
jgi:hypothetical protein